MKGKTISALICAGLAVPGLAFAQAGGMNPMRGEDEMQQRRQKQRMHAESPADRGQGEARADRQLEREGVERPGQKIAADQELGGVELGEVAEVVERPRLINAKGKLIDFRAIDIQGKGEHLLAKLQMEGDQTIVLDLGNIDDLRAQGKEPNEFESVRVRGTPGRLNSLPILIVDRYVGEDETLVVLREFEFMGQQQQGAMARQEGQQRQQGAMAQQEGQQRQQGAAVQQREQQTQQFADRQQRQERTLEAGVPREGGQQQQAQQQQTVFLRGELIEIRDIQLQGLDQAHRIAKLRTSTGQTAIVDLGTKDQLEDLNLEQGKWIAVTGERGQINQQPVVFAKGVAKLATIDRSGELQSQDAPIDMQQQDQQQR